MSRPPPRFLFVDIGGRCNLRCKSCEYWAAPPDDPGQVATAERRLELIGEFATLSPGGSVVLCGGENLLDLDGYFLMTTACARLGLRCLSVTNGTVIREEGLAERLIREGPSAITVSLNSHREEVHDRTRGVPGSHRLAVGALRLLVEARRRLGARTPVFAMAVVCEQNYRDLDPFYDFVLNDVGADKLKLNFLQPTFGPADPGGEDVFFAENVVADEEDLASVIAACDRKHRLGLNPAWLEQVRVYHRSVRRNGNALQGWRAAAGTERPLCNSYDRNIMIDRRGLARLCFSTAFPAARLARPGDLRRFWETSDWIRERMRTCRRYCGISHSVRSEEATLKGLSGPSLA